MAVSFKYVLLSRILNLSVWYAHFEREAVWALTRIIRCLQDNDDKPCPLRRLRAWQTESQNSPIRGEFLFSATSAKCRTSLKPCNMEQLLKWSKRYFSHNLSPNEFFSIRYEEMDWSTFWNQSRMVYTSWVLQQCTTAYSWKRAKLYDGNVSY